MNNRSVYECECGKRLKVRQIVKNAVKSCPSCKRSLPQKIIMQCYHRRKRQAGKLRLVCVCGKRSSFPFPAGTGRYLCPRCGASLMKIGTKILNGVAMPRYIEINQKSEVKYE